MSLYLVQALYGTKPRVPEQQQVKTEDTAVDGSTPIKEEGVDEVMSDISVVSQQIVTTRAAESVLTASSDDVRIPNLSVTENFNHQELDAAFAALNALYEVPTSTSTGVHIWALPHHLSSMPVFIQRGNTSYLSQKVGLLTKDFLVA
ncbi:hypothetical protein N0V95_007751 [Ascochyta clinopodiicola]|nr:hypothetical protein N0V95_007751 [Ascochyta clinopodiicola]